MDTLKSAWSAVAAKIDTALDLNPRLLGVVLVAGGTLLIISAVVDSRYRRNERKEP